MTEGGFLGAAGPCADRPDLSSVGTSALHGRGPPHQWTGKRDTCVSGRDFRSLLTSLPAVVPTSTCEGGWPGTGTLPRRLRICAQVAILDRVSMTAHPRPEDDFLGAAGPCAGRPGWSSGRPLCSTWTWVTSPRWRIWNAGRPPPFISCGPAHSPCPPSGSAQPRYRQRPGLLFERYAKQLRQIAQSRRARTAPGSPGGRVRVRPLLRDETVDRRLSRSSEASSERCRCLSAITCSTWP
jgi:hypothetical protein